MCLAAKKNDVYLNTITMVFPFVPVEEFDETGEDK
jgi:hypothetical protein